jgi:dyslexia susceptibility 1 candidate gene 1 protein
MPLTGNYSWSETKDQIVVEVPLKGVSPTKVDILATSSTLKVNFSPYLIDIVLFKEIDPLRHKARVKNGVLYVILVKINSILWGTLGIEGDDEKERIRQEASTKQQALEEELSEKRKDRRVADERHSTRKQMALEEAERTRLETKKDEEKKAAEEAVYSAFSQIQASKEAEIEKTSVLKSQPKGETNYFGKIDEAEPSDDEQIEEVYSANYPIAPDRSSPKETSYQQKSWEEDSEIKYVPPPRSFPKEEGGKKVGITFTPRVFPTPMRESKQSEEQDWIAKNRKHLKKHGQLGKNLTKGIVFS